MKKLNLKDIPNGEMIREGIKKLLISGIPKNVFESSVRIADYKNFYTGKKADWVRNVTLDFNVVFKLGGVDLEHTQVFVKAINARKYKTSQLMAHVLNTKKIEPGNYLLLMESFSEHKQINDLIYDSKASQKHLKYFANELKKILLHFYSSSFDYESKKIFSQNIVQRFEERLNRVFSKYPELRVLLHNSGSITLETISYQCPPIINIIERITPIIKKVSKNTESTCHGDLHLGNVLAREYGKGFNFRVIDPNPEIGPAGIFYDAGKLMHWTEPVGWCAIKEKICKGFFNRYFPIQCVCRVE